MLAAGTGYFLDASHNTSLSRAVKSDTNIYLKVTFSKNVAHVADTDSDARPEIKYQIGTNSAQQFDIVAHNATLDSGECQPDAATPADVYECLYTLTTKDSGSFELQVGTNTAADDDAAELEAAYTHATKLTIDNKVPTAVPPTGSGYYSDAKLSKRLAGPVKAGDDIYVKAEFTENMRHIAGVLKDEFSPNPVMGYTITSLSDDAAFEIVESGTALSHGQCRPDATPPADEFECRYTVQSADRGNFGFYIAAGSLDVAGNRLVPRLGYVYPAKLAIEAPGPKVVAASSGYFQSDSFATELTGPVKADVKIYLKVTFDENVKHTTNEGASARPEIDYKIGTAAAVQFDMLAANATLGSGDCRPDAATPADVYECLYTVASGDNGNFDFTVDTGTQNTTNDPIDQAYTHTTKLAVDTTAPTFVASSSNVNGDTLTMTFSESLKNEKPAASAFAVTVAGSSRSVSSVALSGATAVLTLASAVANDSLAVTVLYTNPGGTNAKLQDPAGNEVATFTSAQSVTNNTGTPYVLTASSGYFSDANLTKSLPGPVQGGKDIYAKISFNENVTHTPGDGASARPEVSYKIGTGTAQQFDIVAPGGGTLASGDCRPNHATNTNIYICRYRTANSENGDFDFRVGTATTDTGGTAFASTYTHLTKVRIDNVAPKVLVASSGYFSDAKHTTPITSTVEVGTDIYVKVAFDDIMSHTTGDGEDGRPYLAYTIGTASNIFPFDVLAHGAALASGDCRPATATPSDVYECRYRVGDGDIDSFGFNVGARSEDAAGNKTLAIYRHGTNVTLPRARLRVLSVQSDYYQADSFNTRLTGPVRAGTDIYVKVTFSDNVGHTTGDGDSARPEISYKIGSAAAVQFDILNTSSASLGSGDCRPDRAKPADGYECRYRVQSGDSGDFDFRVGTGTQDPDGKALPVAYTHATKIAVDTTAPTVTAASSGYYTTDSFTTELAGPVNSDSDIYVKVAFSEDVGHNTGDGSGARPELQYKIGTATAERFDIVAPGTALLTGDCRPDHATDRDTYECRYTPLATDGGAFGFGAGVGTEDEAGNALAGAYAHTDKITIDNTAPRFHSARVNGSTLTLTLNETMGSEKAANSAFAITVGGGSRDINSYSLSGARATLTLASAATQTDTVTVAYTKPGGTNPKLQDQAGNALENILAKSVLNTLGPPRVLSANSGYYDDATFGTPLAGPVKASTDIYVKVAFSEDVGHVVSDLAAARPEISHQIGEATAVRFHVVAPGTTLASGDCRPDHATNRDVYECRYTTGSSDSGDFDFIVGTATQDTGGTALASTYTHATKIAVDTTAPMVTAASSGYFATSAFTTPLAGPVNASTDIYVKVAFNEDVHHVTGTAALARPLLWYSIGNAPAAQFEIVTDTATLSSGDCRPDDASDRDLYECLYTPVAADSGDFQLLVDARTVDVAGNAMSSNYQHATKVAIDNTAPTYRSAKVSGSTLTLTFSENLDTSSGARADKSAFAVTVAGSSRAVNSYTLSGKTATLTLASAVTAGQSVTVAYSKPTGTNAKLADLAGNELANFSQTLDLSPPTVTAASSGYFKDAGLSTPLTGPVKASADIYVKVAFSENVGHVVSDLAAARPEISYQIAEATAVQFHIVAPGTTLASGDCRPDHATDRDIYECLYAAASGDNGDFDFIVGTNTKDEADNALASAYTHASAIKIDTTAPTVSSAAYYSDAALATLINGTTVKSGNDIYTKVTFSEKVGHTAGDGIQREAGNQLQDRHRRGRAVRHRGQHGNAGER